MEPGLEELDAEIGEQVTREVDLPAQAALAAAWRPAWRASAGGRALVTA